MISVVIPTYRKPALLARTLEALASQEGMGEFEVVVVDDGSADETTRVLEEARTRLPLRVVLPASNEGRARARNRGWREARGESVLFLDDDIVLEPGGLAAHATAQGRRPAVWMGEVRTAPEVVDSSLFDYLDSQGIAKVPPGGAAPARYLLTQNVSLPRTALAAVNGFDEDFGAYGFEDMEIAFRLEDRCGLGFFRLEGARGWHIHHHSLGEYLEKKVICGRETLPRLAGLHPHRLREMQLDLIWPPGPDSAPRRWMARLLAVSFQLGIPSGVRGLVGRGLLPGPRWLRRRLYDYLVLAAYARGLAGRRDR
jgi:glycosyltransferase involved in cell wall biosynthesis